MKKFRCLSLIVISLLFLMLVIQCEKQPSSPVYDNPLDPQNPGTGGDPFGLSAEISGGGITLTWTPVINIRSEFYRIFRKLDLDEFELFYETDSLAQTSWVDTDISNGHKYTYYISVFDDEDVQINSSYSEIEINSEPVFSIDDDNGITSQILVSLTVLAVGAEKMQIAYSDSLLEFSLWSDYQTQVNLTLPLGEGAKIVWGRFAYASGDTSEAVSDTTFPAPMNPAVIIDSDSIYAEGREVQLSLSAAGAAWIRVSNDSLPDTPGTPDEWIPFSESMDWELSSGTGSKTVWAEFMSEFEAVEAVSDSILPLPISGECCIDHGAEFTSARQVWIFPQGAGANLQMMFSEDQSFSGVEWGEWADSSEFVLSFGAGMKTVYARYSNDFDIVEDCQAGISPLAMNPQFNINHGAVYTASQQVWLFPQAEGDSIYCKFSEDSTFAGSVWQVLADSLSFSLSATNDIKTVYGRFVNDFQIESGLLAATISPSPMTACFTIANDSLYVNHNSVEVMIDCSGALEMKIGETSDSSSLNWQTIQSQIMTTLSDGDGIKRIYGWFKNDFMTSSGETDSVFLDTYAAIDTFYWVANGGDTLTAGDVIEFYAQTEDDMIGAESGGEVTVTFPDEEKTVILNDDGGGFYSAIYTIQSDDFSEGGYFSAQLCDRAGNLSLVFQGSEAVCILTFWERTFDNLNAVDMGYSLVPTSDGGYVVTGTSDLASKDVILLKTDGNGNQQWLRTFDYGIDEGYWVEESNDGGYVITGYSNSGSGLKNVLLIKTDQLGMEEWYQTYGGALNDEGFCVRQSNEGGYIIAGHTRSYGNGQNDIWLIKTDELGSEQWNHTYGSGNAEIGYHVIQTDDGGYAVAGTNGSGVFGYARLIKTDSEGNLLWQEDYIGTQSTVAYSVKQNFNQGYVLTGYSTQSGSRNLLLIITDSSGNMISAPVFGGVEESTGYDIIISGNGGMQITGMYGEQMYIVETGPSGSLVDEQYFSGNGEAEGRCIRLAPDGAFISVGSCLSVSGSERDIYLVKAAP